MAKISLRAYNREIERLVEQSQIEESIAHCRYLLNHFPKHINTYRLYAQALLDSQRYHEAVDVLQRVLASVPDDFVSHLGMSIIREEENQLDAAIWHMERAFEVQPANNAVQNELRRLYGVRDGKEPAKIRLTRGALVRMYARGDLYQQAIAEARASLAEDPHRTDLEVIIARMHYLSGQKVEALEICSRLLKHYPYCLEANRILAEILPATSRAEDASIYQDRVNEMDPYWRYISASAPTAAQVPDDAVELEKLDSSQDYAGADQWTAADAQLGWENAIPPAPPPDELVEVERDLPIDEDEAAEESSEPSPEPVDTVTDEQVDESPEESVQAEDDQIPEWMRSAGWVNLDESIESPEIGLADEDTIIEESQIEAADIPDWVRSLAPQPEAEQPIEDQPVAALAPEETDEDLPDWLKNQSDVDDEEDIAPVSRTERGSPDWLTEEDPVETPQDEAPASLDDEDTGLPDWLRSIRFDTVEDDNLPQESPEGDQAAVAEPEGEPVDAGEPQALFETTVPDPSQVEPLEPEEAASEPVEQPEIESGWIPAVESSETTEIDDVRPSDTEPEDWMAALAAANAAETSSEVSDTATSGTDDNLDAQEERASDDGEAPVEQVVTADSIVQDDATQEIAPQVEESSVISPDVLDQVSSRDESSADWSDSTQPTTEDQPESAPITEPEWSMGADVQSGTYQEGAPEDDIPAWLQELAEDTDEVRLNEPSDNADETEPELDWLQALPIRLETEEESTESVPTPQNETDLFVAETEENTRPITAEPPALADTQEISTAPDENRESTGDLENQSEQTVQPPVDDDQSVALPGAGEMVSELQDDLQEDVEPAIEAEVETETEPQTPTGALVFEMPDRAEEPSSDTSAEEISQPEADSQPVSDYEEAVVEAAEPELSEDETPATVEASDTSSSDISTESDASTQPVQVPHPEAEEPQNEITSAVEPDAAEEFPVAPPADEASEEPLESVSEASEAVLSQEEPVEQPEPIDDHLKATTALEEGDVDTALEIFNRWIETGDRLENAVTGLEKAAEQYDTNANVWQSLGDAYLRNDQIQKALDSYTKAENLLR